MTTRAPSGDLAQAGPGLIWGQHIKSISFGAGPKCPLKLVIKMIGEWSLCDAVGQNQQEA